MAHARIGRTAAVGLVAAVTFVVTLVGGAPSPHRLPDENIRTTLYPRPVFPTPYPWEYGTLAAADFDGDGRQDLAVASGAPGVTILRGQGDGTFEPGVGHPAGDHSPAHVRVADFNADGRPDLAVTDGRGASGVSVLIGRGDGTFLPRSQYPAGDGPYSLAIGDLDGDGHLDMATANIWSNDVSVLLGRGDGTFVPQPAVAAGRFPDSIGIGDLDADGRLDLVATCFSDTSPCIAVLGGRGDGTFDPVATFEPGFVSGALAVADVDADGRLDLIARRIEYGATGGPGFAFFRGRGDRTFDSAALFGTETEQYEGIQSLAVHDLDANGHLDVVMPESEVAIAFGNGDGTFGPQENHGHPGFATAVAFADFDSDGADDIAAIHPQVGGVSVLFNRGARTFARPATYAADDVSLQSLLGDFNGDGHPDVVSISFEAVSLLLGTGEGTLLPEERFPAGGRVRVMVADDFDGDARLDLALALNEAGAVAILRGDGSGSLAPPVLFPSGASPVALVSSDLDHDGDADLAVANGTADSVSILIGAGDATFGAPVPYAIPDPAGLVVGDFDADGDPDLAAGGCSPRGIFNSGCPADDSLRLLEGAGDGTFTVSVIHTFDGLMGGLAARDLDGDGRSDLLVSVSSPARVEMLRSRGDGTFEDPLVVAAEGASLFGIADADVDGFPDLISPGFYGLTILFGNAAGTFTDRRSFLAGSGPRPGLGDLDGDGGLDIVLPLPENDAVLVMLNQHAPDADGDGDGDGIPDHRDLCPTISNPDQDPAACLQEVVSITLSRVLRRGSGTVSWRTTHEVTLLGFNVVTHDVNGNRVQLNDTMIGCGACVTGEGRTYRFLVPKPRRGRDLFIETICSSDCGGPWGPAVRN